MPTPILPMRCSVVSGRYPPDRLFLALALLVAAAFLLVAPTAAQSDTPTGTLTPSGTRSTTGTHSGTRTTTVTTSLSRTSTRTASITASTTPSPSVTPTPSRTISNSATQSATPTITPTPSPANAFCNETCYPCAAGDRLRVTLRMRFPVVALLDAELMDFVSAGNSTEVNRITDTAIERLSYYCIQTDQLAQLSISDNRYFWENGDKVFGLVRLESHSWATPWRFFRDPNDTLSQYVTFFSVRAEMTDGIISELSYIDSCSSGVCKINNEPSCILDTDCGSSYNSTYCAEYLRECTPMFYVGFKGKDSTGLTLKSYGSMPLEYRRLSLGNVLDKIRNIKIPAVNFPGLPLWDEVSPFKNLF